MDLTQDANQVVWRAGKAAVQPWNQAQSAQKNPLPQSSRPEQSGLLICIWGRLSAELELKRKTHLNLPRPRHGRRWGGAG